MSTLTISYDGRNKTARSIVEMLRSLDFFNITEDCNGIEDAEFDNVQVYTRDGRIVVDGADGERVHVLDMMGRPVANSVLSKGVYMVKIGDRPACKVIVL